MPLVRYAIAAAALCLLGGVAVAQPTDSGNPPTTAGAPPAAPNDQSALPSSNQGAAIGSQPGQGDVTPSELNGTAQTPPMDTTATTGAAANTSATLGPGGVQVIASAPVPDTPANRAKYGKPMSRAGQRTAAAGN